MTAPSPMESATHDSATQTLIGDLRALLDVGKAYASAELDWQKARAGRAVRGVRSILLLGLLALALVFFALMALVLGVILALTPLLTPIGATVIVVVALIVLALVSVGLAASRWKAMRRDIADEAPPRG